MLCSMQFGQRVKSVTLAEYKSDEVEHMKEGGNQVAAYKYLARYTPDKDLKKPLDRNPQRIRAWVQTVFIDKKYYSADAPVPLRSSDAGSASAGQSAGSFNASRPMSRSVSRSDSSTTRESGAAALSPSASAPSHSSHLAGSPPVRDVRELLGSKVTPLQVGPIQASSEISRSDSRASSVSGATAAAATSQASTPADAKATAFDPFAAPETHSATLALAAIKPALPTPAPAAATVTAASQDAFDPFSQLSQSGTAPAATQAGTAAGAGATTASAGWAAFDEPSAFVAGNKQAPAQPQSALQQSNFVAAPLAAAAVAADSNASWHFSEDNVFAAKPADAAAAAALSGQLPAVAFTLTAATPAAVATAASSAPDNAVIGAAAGATPSGSSAAGSSTPATPGGSGSKGGKAPAKELAADLFSQLTPTAVSAMAYQPGPAFQWQQFQPQQQQYAGVPNMQPAAAGVTGLQQLQPPQQPLQQQYGIRYGLGMSPGGYVMPQQQQMSQYQPQTQWQMQQQQQRAPAYGMYGPGAQPFVPGYQQRPDFAPYPMYVQGMNGTVGNGPQGPPSGTGIGFGPQQQQQPGVPSSGSPSVGFPTWVAASTAAGVTEQNTFADLVDLKKALPTARGSSTPAGPAMQQQPFGAAAPAYGMQSPYVAAPGMGAGAAAGAGMGFNAIWGSGPASQPGQPYGGMQQQLYGGAYGSMPLSPGSGQVFAARAPQVQQDSSNPFA
eukprot:GHRR01035818.1.p1 GENE.GHRR01035818.1~~GHRR01035818.1.p1  ORF type:complete len:725 (+),score=359.89 GHRR01035818.1:290-2464(+)